MASQRKSGSLGAIILGLFGIGISVCVLWWAGTATAGYLTHTDNVATVEGQIVSGARDASPIQSSVADPVVVLYEYTIDNTTYVSSRVFASGKDSTFGSHDVEAELVAVYSEGTTVTVHYDPANPRQAFLRYDSLLSLSTQIVIHSILSVLLGLGSVIWLLDYIS